MKHYSKFEIFGNEVLSYRFTSSLPELLEELNCSLIISTLKSNHVFTIGVDQHKNINHQSTSIIEPYGIAYENGQFAVGSLYCIETFNSKNSVVESDGSKYNEYHPSIEYRTEVMKLHDLHFGEKRILWAVNSNYSCLCTLDDRGEFSVKWKPFFIDELKPGDSCHLNGLAMKNKKPTYISALGKGTSANEWRNNIMRKGILMDIESNEIILNKLSIPHTPRIFNDQLYMLLSGTGELICVDVNKGQYDTLMKLPGFVRGMAKIKDYLIVGISKPRKDSRTFGHLKIEGMKNHSSVIFIHLPSARIVGEISYDSIVEDIYEILIYPNKGKPALISSWGQNIPIVKSELCLNKDYCVSENLVG